MRRSWRGAARRRCPPGGWSSARGGRRDPEPVGGPSGGRGSSPAPREGCMVGWSRGVFQELSEAPETSWGSGSHRAWRATPFFPRRQPRDLHVSGLRFPPCVLPAVPWEGNHDREAPPSRVLRILFPGPHVLSHSRSPVRVSHCDSLANWK